MGGSQDRADGQGVCYVAQQDALDFGLDRRRPVATRPVVSLRATGAVRYVLPATHNRRPDFYRMSSGRCRCSAGARPLGEGFLAPWPEAVAVFALVPIGTLVPGELTAITEWLRRRSGEGLT